ncbi:hypothetical protein JMUB6875_59410 [Nocardia sp. JMUB6875]|uniref:LLM class flavin-dependent oxidoreductase n=1 Tax=Nocardia sp. JMUB6875 TaxID=3158170 RepID=UPI0032E6038A
MYVVTALRFNMTGIHDASADHVQRYRAAVEMAEYADQCGLTCVSCEEHHLSATGWLPSPLVLAAALAARTRAITIAIGALIVPLHDPIRLAEDIAVLDNLAPGRLSVIAGIGYRPEEYAAAARDWARRGKLMDENLEVMRAAWGEQPFEYRGETITVTPKPHTRPHPLLFIGGGSAAAAKRAARFGLPFSPAVHSPFLATLYHEELKRHGRNGFVHMPLPNTSVVLLHREPDRAWTTLGPFILNEIREYSAWGRPEVARPNEAAALSVEHLRTLNYVEILTPEELRDQIAGGRTQIVMNPLIGGIPLEDGWASLRMLCDEVLAKVGG